MNSGDIALLIIEIIGGGIGVLVVIGALIAWWVSATYGKGL